MSTTEHHQPTSQSTANGHHRDPGGRGKPPERLSWAVLALALVAQVLVVLDISVVNTALPTIGADLQLSSGDLQWVVTAYLLMSGGGLLLGGRIADLLSRRRVLITGLAVFTTASLVSGFASTAGVLVGARAAQGLGAALMTPAALAIIMTTYAGAQRAKGLAMWGAVGGLGIAAGVLVGGVITTFAGWQMIFWVNVPIGVGAIIAALVLLGRNGPARPGLAPTGPARARSPPSPAWPRSCSASRARPATAGHHRKHLASCPSRHCCWLPSGSSSGGWRIRWCRRTPGGSRPWSPGRA